MSTVSASAGSPRPPPVFMTHNTHDDIVPFGQGRQLGVDWCEVGADVRFVTVDEDRGALLNHGVAAQETQGQQWEFLRSVVAGDGPAQPSNCGEF